MSNELIHDRGRGPEIIGTRITVYNLLPYFIDQTVTEEYITTLYSLTAEQVAAARAYILNNPDTVLATHLKIEERIAAGNPPEVVEQAKRTHERLLKFKEWLEKKAESDRQEELADAATDHAGRSQLPAFREWVLQQNSPEPS